MKYLPLLTSALIPALALVSFRGFIADAASADATLPPFDETVSPPPPDAFLSVPISGDPRISAKFISAVLDHSIPTGYNCNRPPGICDGVVLAFDNSEGSSSYGEGSGSPPGYPQEGRRPFSFRGHFDYVGAEGGVGYLEYDGHSGYDFRYERGRPILAAATGTLIVPTRDPVNNRSGSNPQTTYNTLKIEHENGYETWYLHAIEGSECIAFGCDRAIGERPHPGDRVAVRRGQPIAEVGTTSPQPIGPHLHFEVRMGAEQVVDPFGCAPAVAAKDPGSCGRPLWLTGDGAPDGTPARRFVLTIIDAVIRSTKSDGRRWDVGFGGMEYPDPVVVLYVDGRAVCATPEGLSDTTLPAWNQRCTFVAEATSSVHLVVYDWDPADPDFIGEWQGTMSDLQALGGQLQGGAVQRLQFSLESP